MLCWLILTLLYYKIQQIHGELAVDPNGYVVYCPCMGRFGNQADHLLGSLAFAKKINRTLILPPWIVYRPGRGANNHVPFDNFFDVEPLKKYHRVVEMHDFMNQLAKTVWPPQSRLVFCWSSRSGPKINDCNAKDGNPFGPFWDHFNIDFVGSKFYGHVDSTDRWQEQFPADAFPVLAFVGAPAEFPVLERNRHLQSYLVWSSAIEKHASDFIENFLNNEEFLGIHLRNDLDWPRVCELITTGNVRQQLFSSAQCLGSQNQFGQLTMQICAPTKQEIPQKVREYVTSRHLKFVYVASDHDHMLQEFNELLKPLNARALMLNQDNAQVDLAILGKATYFIGNCVSSFSSFVKRHRDVKKLPSDFWGMSTGREVHNGNEEL